MNIKRILSSALVAVMLFASMVVLIPTKASAAHASSVTNTKLNTDQVIEIVEEYQKAKYNNAEELFQDDLSKGYLDYSTNGEYTIYVNRYTGVMYYRNNKTSQMLTSNSYNFGTVAGTSLEALTSQIAISYSTVSSTENPLNLYSSTWAAKYNQISVDRVDGGLRVNYAVGDTANRCLLPVMIEMNDFEEYILMPMMDYLYDKMVECFGEAKSVHFRDSVYYDKETIETSFLMHRTAVTGYTRMIDNMAAVYQDSSDPRIVDLAIEIEDINSDINTVVNAYVGRNPNATDMVQTEDTIKGWEIPATLEGYAVYEVQNKAYAQMAVKADIVKVLCPNYTFDTMYQNEKFCGYVHKYEPKPVFRCSLEYTINEDNTLSVRLPSNSISFDETQYILKSITPLQYFGAGDFTNDGYIFLPDGSGSIIEFEDFRGSNIAMSSNLENYGHDYCYSEISGAHRQQITMPVYGIVSQVDNGNGLVDTGYFAILEEGASMAAMNVTYSNSFREGAIFSTFTPYPADKFDLSDTISVGNAKYYTMVSESKYTGSYVTRYVMLSNNVVPGESNYSTSYAGMAEYYRQYLINNGVLSELEDIQDDLPLYIEAFGSMEIVEKFLTFPVNVSKPITTFDDIVTMYEELGNAKQKLLDKAAEYQTLADEEEKNLELKHRYLTKAEEYRALSEKVVNIDNINFKLTGFTNGGMYYTYPTKIKWEKAVGGKRGFKELLEVADSYNTADSNFGVYPDFDFQYINNTSAFDGVGKRNTVSRMVDNRYASKQLYSCVLGEYDTVYAMIISSDSLDRLYDKFIKKYSKYDATGISVSTLGSDLNSNFDKKNPISRDDAQGYVSALLDRMANESNYSVMISKGNIYAVEYADHILDICTDSSYYRYSSYTIPFVGMILHGYVNYSGSALNYSGSPDYDLLRSIENGASLYYILGYRNTELMKDDEELNRYYSVSYDNWFDDIVENYAILNGAIGDLQDYHIVDHRVLVGERVIEESEQIANLTALKTEFVDQFDKQFQLAIDEALADIRANSADYNVRIGVEADIDNLMDIAFERFELDDGESLGDDFKLALEAVLAKYNKEYNVEGVDPANVHTVSINSIDYDSQYKYVTGSLAEDDDYVHTDYTVDNDLIVVVVYKNNEGKTRTFILNYNIYSVEVNLDDNTAPYIIGKYGFQVIEG